MTATERGARPTDLPPWESYAETVKAYAVDELVREWMEPLWASIGELTDLVTMGYRKEFDESRRVVWYQY